MRIDMFGFPVQPVFSRKPLKNEIPATFRRSSKAEDRAEKMATLSRRCDGQAMSDEEMAESAVRVWKRFVREVGWEKAEENDEKEK